jgi:hypothetical protein
MKLWKSLVRSCGGRDMAALAILAILSFVIAIAVGILNTRAHDVISFSMTHDAHYNY